MPSKPMIIQGDGTILLEVDSDSYSECRDWLSRFAELVKTPEHIHTYKITPIAIWNAAASGLKSQKVLEVLLKYSKYPIPQNIVADIQDWFSRYGKIKLEKIEDKKREDNQSNDIKIPIHLINSHYSNVNLLLLSSFDELLITEIYNNKSINKYVIYNLDSKSLLINADYRGQIKNALIKIGYPVEDLVGYIPGDPLPIKLRDKTASTEEKFYLRHYQNDASEAFYVSGSERGGSGVVVMPCGAGKTIVGIDIISKICQETLIIGSSTVGVRQWIRELVEKSFIDRKMIGEYTGDLKELKPITVTTYQCLTYCNTKTRYKKEQENLNAFRKINDMNYSNKVLSDNLDIIENNDLNNRYYNNNNRSLA